MRLSRGDVVDLLVRGDECLVLTGHSCVRLTPVATAIVSYLDRTRTLTDVQAHVEDIFGTAPPGRLLDIVRDLADQQIIHVGSEVDRSANS